MTSPAADPARDASALADLRDRMRSRLAEVRSLSDSLRDALRGGRAEEIEGLTATLESTALEFRVLEEEHRRLSAASPEGADDPRARASLDALRAEAGEVARTAAVAGGLLARLVGMHRALAAVVGQSDPASYGPEGRAPDLSAHGVRLRQRA